MTTRDNLTASGSLLPTAESLLPPKLTFTGYPVIRKGHLWRVITLPTIPDNVGYSPNHLVFIDSSGYHHNSKRHVLSSCPLYRGGNWDTQSSTSAKITQPVNSGTKRYAQLPRWRQDEEPCLRRPHLPLSAPQWDQIPRESIWKSQTVFPSLYRQGRKHSYGQLAQFHTPNSRRALARIQILVQNPALV